MDLILRSVRLGDKTTVEILMKIDGERILVEGGCSGTDTGEGMVLVISESSVLAGGIAQAVIFYHVVGTLDSVV